MVMNINQVTTAKKVADFVLVTNSRNKIGINYLNSISNSELTDDCARIYLIVVDGIIKKIGGSSSSGGIKATMNFYVNAMTGSPGVPRFVIHLLIERELRAERSVELYIITSPRTMAVINGLLGSREEEIASFKEMENYCKSDYFNVEGQYPDWNFQENHQPYPSDLANLHVEYHRQRLIRNRRA
jgi:hypothetical protein